MTCEIISIGDELLIGQVVNTNASWMAEQLSLAGIKVVKIIAISDQNDQILEALSEAGQRARLILITGGLGPTKDDITKQSICEFFNTNLVFDESVYQQIIQLFKSRGFSLNHLNRAQAEIPKNCTPIKNENGTAPGMWFEKDSKIYVSMPGVPFEMKPMISGYVIPEILKRFKTPEILHKTILTHGVPESVLAGKIEDWENKLPENIKLAYLPQPGIVRLRITATGQNKIDIKNQIKKEITGLKKIIPKHIFGYDNDTLYEIVGSMLRKKGLTISTAESCTGGYITHLITSVAGSSDYFRGSVIAYSNEIKEAALHVSRKSFVDHGAVSEEVVIEMADGIRQKFNTDYAIATSGIAGPGGGTPEKPVGTIWIAIATPSKTLARLFNMGNHRQRNIHKAALAALDMLRLEMC